MDEALKFARMTEMPYMEEKEREAWAFIRSEDGTTGSVGAYTWSIAAAILTTCLGIPLALALPRHKRPPAAGSKAVMKPAPVAG